MQALLYALFFAKDTTKDFFRAVWKAFSRYLERKQHDLAIMTTQ
jgi:hypothetical protein